MQIQEKIFASVQKELIFDAQYSAKFEQKLKNSEDYENT